MLDGTRNEGITVVLNVCSVEERTQEYNSRWIEQTSTVDMLSTIDRMVDSKLPKQIKSYKPKGRKDAGRPRKRLE